MSNINYKQFKEASKKKSLEFFNSAFVKAFKENRDEVVAVGLITYCTIDDETRFFSGMLPTDMKDMERLRDKMFDTLPKGSVKYLSFSTLGVVNREDPSPSIVLMTCDREIWDVDHAPVTIEHPRDRTSGPINSDSIFGIMNHKDNNIIDVITLNGDWECVSSTGNDHSDIANIFMERMR